MKNVDGEAIVREMESVRDGVRYSVLHHKYRPFYYQKDGGLKALPVALYEYNECSYPQDEWLEKIDDGFTFQHKVYKVDDFNETVLESYRKRQANTGILFNGEPGTGKTVHTKLLANASGLPIILVNQAPGQQFLSFVAKIGQPCCFVFDEFEKYVGDNENVMLALLDGMATSDIAHLFIFTTNTLNVNNRFLGRPSRIRYIKTFDNLPVSFFEEYIKDNLEDMSLYDKVFDFVKDIMTMDIVKAVVDEVNAVGFREDILEAFNIKSDRK